MLAARTHRVNVARGLYNDDETEKNGGYELLQLFMRGEKLQPSKWQKDFVSVACG